MPDAQHLNAEIRDMLMDCGLFDTLQPGDFLAAAGYFSLTAIDAGQAIFSEGDAGTFMCILHRGVVSVRKRDANGVQVEIATLRKGRAFGEMAVLDGERRSATCVAASDCQLLTLGRDSLDKMINDAPRIAARIIRALAVALSRRLRMQDGQRLAQQI
ncbi:cyclic nucleotide-binding domain-containing protein [Pseudomonas entomophila]|uniref:cyclic nucleotide-binding domain-containing protein n=1 Tax=Pseudomonas entomophila TaxID=312306 RepID=UPI001BCEE34B|nr:cyclic nucleotide-binding domain-containing protein [Pseudomonas entomophila]QVM90119.1 cyclic nucleotide-binding domain-containing protein [Pseudomonas entomophila]